MSRSAIIRQMKLRPMTPRMIPAMLILAAVSLASSAQGLDGKPFAANVDAQTGAISVPADYSYWTVLGTWTHANTGKRHEESGPGSSEHHIVYTQPETLRSYNKDGKFPDGAVLVKELRHAETMPMTTGPAVSHPTALTGWFVLVRDTQGRYPDSPFWGDGWGWSFFEAGAPDKTVTRNYKVDCLPCHVPARQLAPGTAAEDDKWIYTLGYPALRNAQSAVEARQ